MNFGNILGIGVAGNFTGHLEQAGEAKDFAILTNISESAPKGIFPFYILDSDGFLSVNPLSSTRISLPKNTNLQPEPEVALLCNAVYKNKKVVKLLPTKFAAFNDCSIREDTHKISRKKNWGPHSKGVSDSTIDIDTFAPGGILDSYAIASYLQRDGELHEYGIGSPVNGYTYFYDSLIDWLIDRLNNQKDEGPLENTAQVLETAGYPEQILIAIGATRYTDFGESTYLQEGDEIYVVVHPKSYVIHESDLVDGSTSGETIVLRQKVIGE